MDFSKYILKFEREMQYKRLAQSSINCYNSCLKLYFEIKNLINTLAA